MTSLNLTNLLVDSNFNTIIEISLYIYIHCLYIPNQTHKLYSITKILVISCFHCLQNDDVIKCYWFANWFKFQHHKWNQHHEPPLHAKFQPCTSVCSQDTSNFMFSISSKWWRYQFWSISKVVSNLNSITKISIISYLFITNFSFILHFITKIQVISCFHCLQNYDIIEFD